MNDRPKPQERDSHTHSRQLKCGVDSNSPFSDEESDGSKEGHDAHEGGKVAGAGVLVHDAHLFAFRLKVVAPWHQLYSCYTYIPIAIVLSNGAASVVDGITGPG